MGATPRQPGSLDRKAWSHLGYCLDVEVGIDASNLVFWFGFLVWARRGTTSSWASHANRSRRCPTRSGATAAPRPPAAALPRARSH
eukprot:844955-Pyramimonas_sp.AAC.1